MRSKEVNDMSKSWDEIGLETRAKFEDLILSWNNSVMNYEEGWISSTGRVEIKVDDWGVTAMLHSDDFDEPVRLRAAWCILRVYENGMSGAYVNWHLSADSH